MSFRYRSHIVVASLASFILASGCGSGGGGPKSSSDPKEKQLYQGDLMQLVESIQVHSRAEPCDRSDYEIRKELVSAISAHQNEIIEFTKKPSSESRYEPIEFKSITFRKLKVRPERIKEVGFYDYRESWRSIYIDYVAGKDQASPQFWASLNARIRGIIIDDEGRVIGGLNYSYGPNSAKGIRKLDEEIKVCEKDESCTKIQVSPESQEFLKSHPFITKLIHRVNSASDSKEARTRVKELREETYSGRELYMLHPYDGVKRVDQNTYSVQLSPGEVEDQEALEFIKKQIESDWKMGDKSVKVIMGDLGDAAYKVMKLVFSPIVGERAFISRKKATMNLFSGTRTTTLSHEFGHVLGFQDRYFTLWEPETCSWNYPIDESDIMGDHETGGLHPEHWEDLDFLYPMNGVSPTSHELPAQSKRF